VNIPEELARLLAASRFSSVAEVAREAGMESMQVRRIFRGENRNPGILTVERIVTAMAGRITFSPPSRPGNDPIPSG
jgi:DNA-binding phage protein